MWVHGVQYTLIFWSLFQCSFCMVCLLVYAVKVQLWMVHSLSSWRVLFPATTSSLTTVPKLSQTPSTKVSHVHTHRVWGNLYHWEDTSCTVLSKWSSCFMINMDYSAMCVDILSSGHFLCVPSCLHPEIRTPLIRTLSVCGSQPIWVTLHRCSEFTLGSMSSIVMCHLISGVCRLQV